MMTAQAKTKEPNVVNGINVDDLFSLIEGVRHDATKAKTNWRVSTTWQGQTRSRSRLASSDEDGASSRWSAVFLWRDFSRPLLRT
jgi:hypothetical protein